jgi:KaiC/GvpD/RAD55 family RecA-like ATPase
LIRTVPTGDIGFDAILGGGWRLVERLPGRESATVVVRGGPGTGKTLLSIDIALALATSLGGDVVVACVELLPSEYFAQMEAGRAELVSQQSRVVMLPHKTPVPLSSVPRVFCGLLSDSRDDVPDLVEALATLSLEVMALGGNPSTFVVDSLTAGYGLGHSIPRQNVDAVMKFAAQGGHGLVLCEETTDDTPTAWDFAVDTLLALDQNREGGRQIVVRKHRYGASETGEHQFEIRGWNQPNVYPRLDVWAGKPRRRSILEAYGWQFLNGGGPSRLRWTDGLAPASKPIEYNCSLAVLSGPNLEVIQRLAFGLVPIGTDRQKDLFVYLDPVGYASSGWSSKNLEVRSIPIALAANASVCKLVEYLGSQLFRDNGPRRVIIGDLASTQSFADSALWAEGIGVLAALVAESGWGIPVVVYASTVLAGSGFAAIRWRADLLVEGSNAASMSTTSRRDGKFDVLQWSNETLTGQLPKGIEHLAGLPGSQPSR